MRVQTMPTGTLMKKIQRQDMLSEIQPPRIGPQIGATRVVIDQVASARARRDGAKIEISSACEPGIIVPENPPCTTRQPGRHVRFQATPHRKEPKVNSATEAAKVFATP